MSKSPNFSLLLFNIVLFYVFSFGHFLKVYIYIYPDHMNIILIISVHMTETFWSSKSQSILKAKTEKLHSVKYTFYKMLTFRNSPHSGGKWHIQYKSASLQKRQSWVKEGEASIWEELGEWKWVWPELIVWNPSGTIKIHSKECLTSF